MICLCLYYYDVLTRESAQRGGDERALERCKREKRGRGFKCEERERERGKCVRGRERENERRA